LAGERRVAALLFAGAFFRFAALRFFAGAFFFAAFRFLAGAFFFAAFRFFAGAFFFAAFRFFAGAFFFAAFRFFAGAFRFAALRLAGFLAFDFVGFFMLSASIEECRICGDVRIEHKHGLEKLRVTQMPDRKKHGHALFTDTQTGPNNRLEKDN
jgi:hypothetical protein